MIRYRLSAPAAADLYDIDRYVSQDDPAAAERVIAGLEHSMRLLVQLPAIGHLRPELGGDTYRFFVVDSYLIVYLPDTKPLQIVRILHQRRDYEAALHTG